MVGMSTTPCAVRRKPARQRARSPSARPSLGTLRHCPLLTSESVCRRRIVLFA